MGVGPCSSLHTVKSTSSRIAAWRGPRDERCAGQLRRPPDRTDSAAQRRAVDVPGFLAAGREGLQHISYWTTTIRPSTTAPVARLCSRPGGPDRRPKGQLRLFRHPSRVTRHRDRISDVSGHKGASSSGSGRSPPVGTVPIPCAKSGGTLGERCVPSSRAPTVPF